MKVRNNAIVIIALSCVISVLGLQSFAEDGHDHGKESKNKHAHAEDDHKGHDNGKADEHKGHEDSEEEENQADHSEVGHSDHGNEDKGHDDHDEHGENSFGEGKAIVAIENDGKRFQLSNESAEFLKIGSMVVGESVKNGRLKISKENLVEYQDKVGVFIRRGNWFELKEAKVLEEKGNSLVLAVHNVSASDQIVTSKLGILRAAYLQATRQGGKGHAH